MGDRFTYGFVNPGGDVLYLYSHWGGSDWNERLSDAMRKAGARPDDAYYANRIMVSQIIGEDWDKTHGYGFSVNEVFDTEYNFVPVVDWARHEVSVYLYRDAGSLGPLLVTFPIKEFVNDPFRARTIVLGLADNHG
jgi:hypothetical protein